MTNTIEDLTGNESCLLCQENMAENVSKTSEIIMFLYFLILFCLAAVSQLEFV